MVDYNIVNRKFFGNIDCHKTLIDISNFPQNEEVVINCDGIIEINPFNILVISNALKQHQRNYDNLRFNKRIEGSYLDFMGFYRNCGFDSADRINSFAYRQGKYISITPINLCTGTSFENDYDNIDSEAKKMASMLGFDQNLSRYVIYCFTEMMRNVFEHSGADRVYVCAQYWPFHQLVEIAISDMGCGIKAAMNKHFHGGESNMLKLAMFPGISARSNFGWFNDDNAYKNSGYGLYLTKELSLAYAGSFMLCSGHYVLDYNNQGNKIRKSNYNGTAIAIRFSTDVKRDFAKTLQIILKKAENLSMQRDDAIHKASKSSGGYV